MAGTRLVMILAVHPDESRVEVRQIEAETEAGSAKAETV
jgi:hypothetical protein